MSTNFSDTTPPALSGVNVLWQHDNLTPRNDSGYVGDANGSTKGVIKLAGDLGGTAAAPTNAHGPYDIGIPIVGQPGASESARYTFPRTVTFPADFVGSFAVSATASAGTLVFDVKQNNVSIGSVTFTASDTGVFSTGGLPVTFVAGDLFELVAPASPDTTWANGNFTFTGSR
jgi:hypothetical protein